MIATEAEMISAKLPLEERDYCAHKKIDYLACRADVWPWAYKCAHAKHEVLSCLADELVFHDSTHRKTIRNQIFNFLIFISQLYFTDERLWTWT